MGYAGCTAKLSEPSNSTSFDMMTLLMIQPGLLRVKVSMEVPVVGSGVILIARSDLVGT